MADPRDLLAVQAAISGRGDIEKAIDIVLDGAVEPRLSGLLAAQLISVLLGDGQPGDMGHVRRLDELLQAAERNPPPDPNWPRVRAAASSVALLLACGEGRITDGQLAEKFDALLRETAGDPQLRQAIETQRMLSVYLRSARLGDLGSIARLQQDLPGLRGKMLAHPQGEQIFDAMHCMSQLADRLQRYGASADLGGQLAEIATSLPEGSALRATLNEAVREASMMTGGAGFAAADRSADLPALERAVREPGLSDEQRIMRHLAAGGAALCGGEETDVSRVRSAVEHFRGALALSSARDPQRPFYLCSLALGLIRHNELTNRVADLDSAVAALHEARDLARQAGGPRHPHWSLIHELLSAVSVRSGDPEAPQVAVDALRNSAWRVLVDDDPASARRVALDAADTALNAARGFLIRGDAARAVTALEGGRGLMLFAATEWQQVESRLSAAGRADLAERWRRERDAADSFTERAQLRRDVLAILADETGLLDPPSTKDIAGALGAVDADALVYLLPAATGVPGFAIIVAADGEAGNIGLPNLSLDEGFNVEGYIKDLSRQRDLIGDTATADRPVPGGAADLCDWAWRAAIGPLIDNYLSKLPKPASGRPHRLILVPVGVLALVPWQAARRSDGDFAVRRVAVSQAVSARMLCRSAAQAPVAQTPVGLVVGDPDTSDPADRLLAARVEAYAIHQSFYRGGRYLGTRADGTPSPAGAGTAQQVRDWLSTKRPGTGTMLHLACHGVVGADERNATSYLVLAGGERLTAAQIVELMGRSSHDIGLAVLAACRTGLSIHGYDEAYSLGTAFLAGGVRSVLSTQWRVPDAATSLLMFMFHHYLMVEHLPAWAALWRAQLWMIDPERQPPPEMPARLRHEARAADVARIDAWAGFVHWGR